MKNQKVSCLAWTLVFFALAGASAWFVQRRAPTSGAAFFGGLTGGILLLIVVGWLTSIPARFLEWYRIAGARLGKQPRDGEVAAIIGTLRGHGELHAPFSRERCVLYDYSIVVTDRRGNTTFARTAYEGFAMVPLTIEHDGERTRILAKPELPALPARRPRVDATAKQFVENTTFTPKPAKEKDLTHTDGHLRYDTRTEPVVANISDARLSEKTLAAETSVCVLGVYRADRQALIAPVKLRTGSAFGIAAAWRVVNAGIGAVIFATIALIAAAIFCANHRIEVAESAESRLAWWEVDLERFVEKHVRAPLVRSGVMTESGFYLFEVCDGCANGRMEIDGRSVELTHAAYLGGLTVHISARKGERDGITLNDKEVALTVNGKTATVPPSWLQEHDIETSLGSEGEYSGRITVIAPDRWIRCRVTFRTRVDENAWLTR